MSHILDRLTADIGQTWHSDWLTVDQPMIDAFAAATGDHQFIHIDPVAAAATPFGGTVAHGFLTLSLLTRLLASAPRPPVPGIRMGVNYGVDGVRFVAPVRSGSRVRGAFTLTAIEEKRPGQFQQTLACAIEIDGGDKPALVATWLGQFFV
ncbi:MaoC family dehydratase [Sphingomonas abietis]|uniref:MaoC family dehydratase n=1 Tax=Sphingomonas abietis TaxID=3012344 RepID=A0ABY7NJJ8_9SPHN|nr:MaoC family dehydratase [Sphingomonas abietis]WBO21701.1 MaoC family dehydratase [Sphingomonas abietis]